MILVMPYLYVIATGTVHNSLLLMPYLYAYSGSAMVIVRVA